MDGWMEVGRVCVGPEGYVKLRSPPVSRVAVSGGAGVELTLERFWWEEIFFKRWPLPSFDTFRRDVTEVSKKSFTDIAPTF